MQERHDVSVVSRERDGEVSERLRADDELSFVDRAWRLAHGAQGKAMHGRRKHERIVEVFRDLHLGQRREERKRWEAMSTASDAQRGHGAQRRDAPTTCNERNGEQHRAQGIKARISASTALGTSSVAMGEASGGGDTRWLHLPDLRPAVLEAVSALMPLERRERRSLRRAQLAVACGAMATSASELEDLLAELLGEEAKLPRKAKAFADQAPELPHLQPRTRVPTCTALLAHAASDQTALYHRLLPRDTIVAVDRVIEANAWRWSDAAQLLPMALPPLEEDHTVEQFHRTVLADGEDVLIRVTHWQESLEEVPFSEYVRSFVKHLL